MTSLQLLELRFYNNNMWVSNFQLYSVCTLVVNYILKILVVQNNIVEDQIE